MASSSYFGRPLESQSSLASQSATQSTSSPLDRQGTAIPNLLNVTYSAHHHARSRMNAQVSVSIPEVYLLPQAVDTAVEIGHGATFTVYRQSIPESISHVKKYTFKGVPIVSKEARRNRPKHVVYKVPKTSFDERGESSPTSISAVRSMVVEMHALAHEPLMKHPNIIKLLGLAWGSSESDTAQRIPVLVVEYASHGTLADLQAGIRLSRLTQLNLCADIAEGLSALHRSAIVHGDLKSENVLIFPSDLGRTYVAKIADFGFSIAGATVAESTRLGGTRPWQAPETDRPIRLQELAYPDVFSFGLLVWRVFSECQNPFPLIAGLNLAPDTLLAAAESLKRQEDFNQKVHFERWLPVVLSNPNLLACRVHELQVRQVHSTMVKLTQQRWALVQSTEAPPSLEQMLHLAMAQMPESATPDAKLFNSIMDNCLKLNPAERNLRKVRELLQVYRSPDSATSANDALPQLDASLANYTLSWKYIPELDQDVQVMLGRTLQNRISHLRTRSMLNEGEHIVLAAMHVNGHGVQQDYGKVKSLLELCAMNGQMVCQAYAYRVIHALRLPTDGRHLNWLARMASLGSRTAIDDLAILEPHTAKDYRQKNRDWKAGVGARFYSTAFMLHNMLMTSWLDLFDSEAALLERIASMGPVSSIRVNQWGDGPLHMAAACGKVTAIQTLLQNFSQELDINQRNGNNETPVFCACRAGQIHSLKLLLSKGADAKLGKHRGEYPIHWLVSFESDVVAEAASLLLAAGADPRSLTTDNISYSHFPPGLDTDHKSPGSPLLWAVHENREDIVRILMNQDGTGDLPFQQYGKYRNPLEEAAYHHHLGCLKTMLAERRATQYSRLVRAAVEGGNRFSMILRNGFQWKQRLTETLVFLADLAKDAVLSNWLNSSGSSTLLLAISLYYPDVVEVLLEHCLEPTEEFHAARQASHKSDPSDVNLQTGGIIRRSHINQPGGSSQRTPLLEAVHTNQPKVYQMLLDHGADPLQPIRNPFTSDEDNWTALHVLSQTRNESSEYFVTQLTSAGLPVDGIKTDDGNLTAETPLSIALFNDAFDTATALLTHGADINATTPTCNFTRLDHPTTILGHIAASSARHSTSRLRFLLHHHHHTPSSSPPSFTVEPTRQLTALHRVAMGPTGNLDRNGDPIAFESYDFATNREICYDLLQYFNTPEHVDAQESSRGCTALMLAVEAANVGVVELLVECGARTDVRGWDGRNVFAVLEGVGDGSESGRARGKAMRDVGVLLMAVGMQGLDVD